MKQLISKVQTKGNIWRFNTLLKAAIQRTYIFPKTIIPEPIFINFIRKIKIFFESFVIINC